MNQIGTPQSAPRRRHLISAEVLARAAQFDGKRDLTRAHGQGNGLRVHAAYIALVSLAVLVAFIVAIAVTSRMM